MTDGIKPGFSFTKLIVSDVDRLYHFYQTVFSMSQVARVRVGEGKDELDEIIMGASGSYSVPTLVIQRYPNRPVPIPGEATLGFVVQDVDATVKLALDAGGEIHRPARAQPEHGVKVAFVRDSDGHLIEIVEPI
jgi:predicted enzyme related to lactoylglutathione lyase